MTASDVAPGVARLLAPNPGPMTGAGTNTYILRRSGNSPALVIDPGPEIAAHRAAILAEAQGGIGGIGEIAGILVTHAHRDHSEGAAALAEATGAPIVASGPFGAGLSPSMAQHVASGVLAPGDGGEGADRRFQPDIILREGEVWRPTELGAAAPWGVTALETPGHLAGHLAFLWEGDGDRAPILFTGDTVMADTTTLVSPPEGDMTAYMATLERLRAVSVARPDLRFLPGHGPEIAAPAGRIDALIAHRKRREARVIAALDQLGATAGTGPHSLNAVTRAAYADTPDAPLAAAERNALAHLLDLQAQGRVSVTRDAAGALGVRLAPPA